MRASDCHVTCHLTNFNETSPVLGVHPKTQNDKLVSVFLLCLEGERALPPCFSRFSPRECFKIGRMYEALTAREKLASLTSDRITR